MLIKRLIKALVAHTPYRIVRDYGANRFDAIETSLRSMKVRGFEPKVIIDGGAHVGAFSLSTQRIFPRAEFHLVEPQPACKQALERLASARGFRIYECALAEKAGQLQLSRSSGPSTGAHVTFDCEASDSVQAETLDALFGWIRQDHRALLKLDLQGYELHALQGGEQVLSATEVILTEVSFFAQAYEPSIATLVAFLANAGFVLYDIAALAGRTRDQRLRQGDFVFVRETSPLLEDDGWA